MGCTSPDSCLQYTDYVRCLVNKNIVISSRNVVVLTNIPSCELVNHATWWLILADWDNNPKVRCEWPESE